MFSQSNKPAGGTQPETKSSPRAETTAAKPASTEPSIISADLRIVGNLHCSGELQVKGNVEGDIKSRSVSIGEGAHVQGSIRAETVQISGSIKGQIEAPAVIIARTARVHGDIMHKTLAVEAGAFLDGNCRHMDAKTPSASLAPAQPAAEQKKTAAGS